MLSGAGRGRVCTRVSSVVFVQLPDDRWSANPNDILEAAANFWITIMRPSSTLPTWAAYEAQYGHLLQGATWGEWRIPDDTWLQICYRIKRHTAPGADGWRGTEIRSLPPSLLLLARDAIEHMALHNTCPTSWKLLNGAPLPKEAYDGNPKDIRIITLLSIW